jgi:hypothetical protein
MRIEFTELEHEKKLRMDAQLALLQTQQQVVAGERAAWLRAVLVREAVPETSWPKVSVFDDRIEVGE